MASIITNIPVHETIKMFTITPSPIPPPATQPKLIENLLLACTTEVPFNDPSGKTCREIDGISMGSSLEPTISKFYISHIENKIFKSVITKPNIYICYVDDILIATQTYDEINKLKQTLNENSVLNFTTELNINKKNPFP